MKKEKLYACVEDLQGCDWFVGDIETIEGWREKAIEWADMDENEDLIKELQKCPKKNVIAFISNIWELKFEEREREKTYKCVKDYSGCGKHEGEEMYVFEWRELALCWATEDLEDEDEDDGEDKDDDWWQGEKHGDEYIIEQINTLPDDEVMDFIGLYFDFKFKEVK